MSLPPMNRPALSERWIIFVIGAVQFANILDFMMVMPLGPDFAQDLGIPTSQLGLIGGAYTAAAAVAGLLGSFWLERFDRRTALVVSMLGLAVGTVSGAFATSLHGLVAARVLAGFWGGPATSVSLSIIADVVPPHRRGKAMGAVMGAFAAASVLGVPAGLELAHRGSWRTPFIAVALLGLVIAAAAWRLLPSLTGHLSMQRKRTGLLALLRRPEVALAMLMTTLVMAGSFSIIPNLASYLQFNLSFPREHLGALYLGGGVVSFFTTRFVGRLVDRVGTPLAGSIGAGLLIFFIAAGYWVSNPLLPVPVLFLGFMLAMGFRNVPYNTLMTLVPGPAERASFLSLQSAVQHLAASLGAFASSRILSERADHMLVGMDHLSELSMGLTVMLPPVFVILARRVRRNPPT